MERNMERNDDGSKDRRGKRNVGPGFWGTRFHVNLSSHHREYLAPVRLGLLVFSVALLGTIIWELRELSVIQAHVREVRPALERVKEQDRRFVAGATKEGFDLSEAALRRLPGDVAFANRLIAERAFSWTKFLGDLEQTVPPRLAINRIQNDVSDSITIRLFGTAHSLEAVTVFILALADHPIFYDPLLGQHRTTEKGLVTFNLTVGYRGQEA